MKLKILLSIAIANIFLFLTQFPSQGVPKWRFVCLPGPRAVPTTFAWSSQGKIALLRWEKSLGNYSPQQRCEQVSPRFQQIYQKGSLNLLTNGYMNNQPVICATKEYGGPCQTLIMTLSSDEDGRKVIDIIKDSLNGYYVGPSMHTNKIFIEINLDEYLRNGTMEN